MIHCIVDGREVPYGEAQADYHSFGRIYPGYPDYEYELVVDAEFAAQRFGRYYLEFLDRLVADTASDPFDDFPETQLDRDFKALYELREPSFAKLVHEQPELVSRVLLSYFTSEFMGFLFHPGSLEQFKYWLATLDEVSIADGVITCRGCGVRDSRCAL
jgi:hypothetical protein